MEKNYLNLHGKEQKCQRYINQLEIFMVKQGLCLAFPNTVHFWPPISQSKKDAVNYKHGGSYEGETWKPLA